MKYAPCLHKLSNGVAVILDPFSSAVASVKIQFKTGACAEKPNQYGLTHFCEHMLCKGTKRLPSAQIISDFLADNAAKKNASTNNKYLLVYGRAIVETVPVLVETLCDMLQNSLFDEKVIETERGVIIDELKRARDNTDKHIANKVCAQLLDNKDFVYKTLGTEENIKSFTRRQMKMWLAQRLSANNCVVCVSGGIENQDALLKLLDEKLGFLKPMDVSNKAEQFQYKHGIVHVKNSNKSQLRITVSVPEFYEYSEENKWARFCTRIYSDFIYDELFRVLRIENGLVYGVDRKRDGPRAMSMNSFTTTVSPENLERVTALMARTMRDIHDGKIQITDEYIARQNARARLNDADWLSSNERRCDTIIDYYFEHGKIYDYYKDVERARTTTAKDVMNFARHFFDRPASFVTHGPDYDLKMLRNTWDQNFGPLPCAPMQPIITQQKTK